MNHDAIRLMLLTRPCFASERKELGIKESKMEDKL